LLPSVLLDRGLEIAFSKLSDFAASDISIENNNCCALSNQKKRKKEENQV
jgi:hypothetical protein